MKKLLLVLFAVLATVANAQVTHLNMQYEARGKVKVRPIKVEIKPTKVIIQYEIVALENIKRLTVATTNDGHLSYNGGNKLSVLGDYNYKDDSWKYLGQNSTWGWDKISSGETVYISLCFNGTIPPGVSYISDVGSLGLRTSNADGIRFPFYNIKIDNPKKYYTSYTNENAIKRNIIENNDGICGIYEIVGNQTKSKLACINNQGQYLLVFMSENNAKSWWNIGDVKAYLAPTASKGMFKTSWIDKNKNKNEDAYATFDGAYLKVKILSGSDKGEYTYIKMYPTEAPLHEKVDEVIELLKNENFQSAIKVSSSIIGANSSNNETRYIGYMLRAYAYSAMELYRFAIADYTSALYWKPEDERAYYERGIAKLYLDDMTGIDDLKKGGELGRSLLNDLKKENSPKTTIENFTREKQSIPQLKKQK